MRQFVFDGVTGGGRRSPNNTDSISKLCRCFAPSLQEQQQQQQQRAGRYNCTAVQRLVIASKGRELTQSLSRYFLEISHDAIFLPATNPESDSYSRTSSTLHCLVRYSAVAT